MSDALNFLPAAADIAPAAVGEGLSAGFGPTTYGGVEAPLSGVAGALPSVPTDFAGGMPQYANLVPSAYGEGGGFGAAQTVSPVRAVTPTTTTPAVSPGATPAAIAGTAIPDPGMDPLGIGATTPTKIAPSDLAASAAGAATGPGFFDILSRNILEPYQAVKKSGALDLLGTGVAGASLISQLAKMQGGQTPLDPLQQQRLQMAQQQQNLAQQYMTGTVPASVQQNIQAQTQARIQQIKDKYARMGMSGSTAEMQEIAGAQAMGSRDLATASTQMVNAGAAMMGLPVQQLASLTREQLAQDEAFSNALAKFVGALAGGPPQTKQA